MKQEVEVAKWKVPPVGLAGTIGLASAWLFDHQGVVVDAKYAFEIEAPTGLDLWAVKELKALGIRRGLAILHGEDAPDFVK